VATANSQSVFDGAMNMELRERKKGQWQRLSGIMGWTILQSG
jgi:hypothetical protein